ncbi:MAG: VWA domain-containing protein [Clostridium sp.]|nr:VWA domain-containing protein [Clostridium sp.]
MKILKGLLSLLLCLCLITPMGSAIVALNDGGIANMGSQTNSGSPTSAPSVTPAPSDTDTPVEAPDYAALYNDLMAAATFAEAHALLEGLTDEQLSAFIDSLTEEQYAALEEHIQSLIAEEPHEVPETVVFTDAGPFFPPVNVGDAWQLLTKSGLKAVSDDNGLETSKTVTINADGSYTITIEAYATGTVATTTRTIPVDIVLVLDQSGSMSFDFDGNSTSTNSNRRQYAMKQAVNNFIAAVADKYNAADSDHRMAIVTFGDGASTEQGWTYVDAKGKNSLQGTIGRLPNEPSGATNIAAGMSEAKRLLGSEYNYTGSNTKRQKVVIVFTDGVPTTNTDFDTNVANRAIAISKELKDAGATVYTVGIFNGANPDELYGASGFDRNSDGTIGSDWSDFSFFMIGDVKGYDVPAGNRFLNYLSSNTPNATEIGIKNYERTFIGIGYYGWEITKNFTRTDSRYYLTAKDSNSLNTIFQTISDQIQHPDIELGSKTFLKDIIAPSFNVPQNTSEIKVQTAKMTSSGKWAKPESASDVTVTIDNANRSISVTGFDYTANFVSENPKPDGSYGKKLIITFTVTMREGFLGGNNVPTNGDSSGIYDGNKLVEFFERPEVNVLIGEVSVTASEKNVYLLGGLTAEQLKEDATVTVGGVSLDLAAADNNYGLDPWQTEYVNISVVIKDASGHAVTDGIYGLSDDTTYSITVTVTPKSAGTGASGEANLMDGESGSNSGAINVFKPFLTFADSEVWYGGQHSGYLENYKSVVWKHGTDKANTETMGNAPELTLNYATTPENAIVEGYIAVPDDIPVNVSVKIGDAAIDEHVKFEHVNCSPENCGFDAATCEFILHVNTCSLTVKKAIAEGSRLLDAEQSFIFTVSYPGLTTKEGVTILRSAVYNVVVVGERSRTIVGLPVGDYTVRENTKWSWRYELVEEQNGVLATLPAESPEEAIVTMTNRLNNEFWLSDEAVATNVFDSNGSGIVYNPTPAIIPGKEDLTDEAD